MSLMSLYENDVALISCHFNKLLLRRLSKKKHVTSIVLNKVLVSCDLWLMFNRSNGNVINEFI